MATLPLNKVWLNLMATGEAVSAPSNGRARAMSVEGEVRTYGGGRRRSISSVGRRNLMPFTLLRLTALQVVTLENWLGRDVMYRDYRGQRIVGCYFELGFREYKDPNRYDITITLNEVTWVEGA